MKTKKFHQTVLASGVLGIAAMLGAAGTASATPTLQILTAAVDPTTGEDHREWTGDSGGTNWATGGGTTAGIGLPSAQLGRNGPPNWPTPASGFAADPTFGNQ